MNTTANSLAGGDRMVRQHGPADLEPAGDEPSSPHDRIPQAARAAAGALLAERTEAGHWPAARPSLTSLDADAVLFELWMDPAAGAWRPRNRAAIDRAAESILARQLPDGGFRDAADPETALGEAAKAYCALKLAGLDAADPRMEATRGYVLERGGLDAADELTRIELGFFGLYPRSHRPLLPVAAMLLPGNVPAWLPAPVRAVAAPLALIEALGPSKPVPQGFDLAELRLTEPGRVPPAPRNLLGVWGSLSAMAPGAIRKRALRAAERWVVEHLQPTGFPAALYRPLLYSVLALDLLGRDPSDPLRAAAEWQLRSLLSGEPSNDWPASVRQTAFAARAICASGEAPRVGLHRAADWILEHQATGHGAWAPARPGVEAGGWSTGYANGLYPDTVTTASVLLALGGIAATDGPAQTAATGRAIRWLLATQRADGGWAVIDADAGRGPFRKATLAGSGTEFTRSGADVTGLVLEALGGHGLNDGDVTVRRGIEYLAGAQQLDGSWRGAPGGGYLYSTACALRGLRAVQVDSREPYVLRAGEWLRSIQNSDGGWGESAAAPADGEYVPAPSQAPETAWGVIGLVAGGDTASGCAQRGIDYLVAHQDDDGTWTSAGAGSSLPGAFDFTSGHGRGFVPLLALAAYREENLLRGKDTA